MLQSPYAFPFRDADPTCPSRTCSGGAIRFRVPRDHNYPVKENSPCFRLVEPNYIHTSATKAPFPGVSTLCTGLPIQVRVIREIRNLIRRRAHAATQRKSRHLAVVSQVPLQPQIGIRCCLNENLRYVLPW